MAFQLELQVLVLPASIIMWANSLKSGTYPFPKPHDLLRRVLLLLLYSSTFREPHPLQHLILSTSHHYPNSTLLTPAVFSLSEVSAPFFQKLSSLLPSSLLPSLHPFLPPFFLPFLLLSLTILQRSQGVRKGGNTSHSFSSSCQND